MNNYVYTVFVELRQGVFHFLNCTKCVIFLVEGLTSWLRYKIAVKHIFSNTIMAQAVLLL